MTYVCNLCPRHCNAIRTDKNNIGGVCGMPYKIRVARAARHDWEEPVISGTNGSGTVFFSGCQLKCDYCQNYDISHKHFGKDITPLELSEIFKRLECTGVHNINLVSATQFIPLIAEAFSIYKPNIPIVFNSGGYESEESIEFIKNFVDIFLLDFKYWDIEKSKKYSAAAEYPHIAQSAIKKAYNLVGPPIIQDGIMKKGVIVRHLLLPLATNDCIEIMKWLKESGMNILFSLMNQYTVMPNCKHTEINRKVTKREYEKVLNKMIEIGLDGFVQDEESASSRYIPAFDLSGV